MRYGSALILSVLGASIATSALTQMPPRPAGDTGFPAGMSVADRKQILQAAGFDLSADLRSATRYCDDKQVIAKVGIGRRDINHDGKDEFFVLSQNVCPGGNGKLHASIVFFDPKTRLYQNMLDVDGQPRIGAQSGTVWPVIDVSDGDKVTNFRFVASDNRYLPLSTIQYREAVALARSPDKVSPGQLPTATWAKPWDRGNLTPGQIAQIFVAAGFRHGAKGWEGCGDGPDIPGDNEIGGGSSIMDLNGDGNPEVVVHEGNCDGGNNNGSSTILSPVPGGWKKVATDIVDTPTYLTTRSRVGWLDFYNGGPGFCHDRYRNDGKGYQAVAQYAESPGGCSGR
ncbi:MULTISPECIES: hypothetical protein [unclassified Novosphingobium]|uniref:hypothetical protein n=1 Tax=unclassified Novosphingobium TaxID=2644732 RepID=UPI00144599AC|nr:MULTISPECIES: hypothetical protein [unclassified Novosphingobium]NKJ45101.1 hypothetical protein [Novosphingobium sp. SG720]NMN06803.1 hypothetical protein [Novosphingobium sp. SG919]NMN88746.1 hypothetical protein [Novosphingobium sp. SG916]